MLDPHAATRGQAIRDRIIGAIELLISGNGYWPSPQQLREALNMRETTLRRHLRILETEGRIQRMSNGHVIRIVYRRPDGTVIEDGVQGAEPQPDPPMLP